MLNQTIETETMMFKGLVIERQEKGVSASIHELTVEDLPAGDVLVDVAYSSLNYKDGLVLQGKGGLVKTYPHVGGIDFAGVVAESADPRYRPGDRVVLTGWRVGEVHWGGYAQKARVKADWLVPLPEKLSLQQAMAVGTAGLTAMLCVMALERHGLTPASGEVIVTGAAGGVGSVAVALLSRLGYRVAASTGRPELEDYLRKLGASEIVPREELSAGTDRPLLSARWAGAIDTVGGTTLASVLAAMVYEGRVAACGLAGGNSLPTTVIPFIIRGVSLLGVDSVMAPVERRTEAWNRIARELPLEMLDQMVEVIGLSDLPETAPRIIKGGVRGRIVVDVSRAGQ